MFRFLVSAIVALVLAGSILLPAEAQSTTSPTPRVMYFYDAANNYHSYSLAPDSSWNSPNHLYAAPRFEGPAPRFYYDSDNSYHSYYYAPDAEWNSPNHSSMTRGDRSPQPMFFYDSDFSYHSYDLAPDSSYNTPNHKLAYFGATPPATAQTSQSLYYNPAAGQSAQIDLRVPSADAKVWFGGALTSQTGLDRTFLSPALTEDGTYTIRVSWQENGKTVERERQVRVGPGLVQRVDFTSK